MPIAQCYSLYHLHSRENPSRPASWRAIYGIIAVDETDQRLKLLHGARQPLNVINLVVENLRNVLLPDLPEEKSAYLLRKLDRIEQQVERLGDLLNQKQAD